MTGKVEGDDAVFGTDGGGGQNVLEDFGRGGIAMNEDKGRIVVFKGCVGDTYDSVGFAMEGKASHGGWYDRWIRVTLGLEP